MPTTDWKIDVFSYGEIWAERIDFSIDERNFLMVFTPILMLCFYYYHGAAD